MRKIPYVFSGWESQSDQPRGGEGGFGVADAVERERQGRLRSWGGKQKGCKESSVCLHDETI